MLLAFIVLTQNTYGQTDSTSAKNLNTLFDSVRTLTNQNKLDLALESLSKAAEMAEKNDDVKSLIDSYHKFAILYLKLDKEDSALLYKDRAKALLKGVEYPFQKH